MKKYIFITIILFSGFMLYSQFSAREESRTGTIPDLISFQGRLTDSMGEPVNDILSIRFNVYDVAVGGSAIWTEDREVTIFNGLFQLNLGELNPLDESYFAAEARWLGVKISADAEMTPRIRIVSTAYSLHSVEEDPTWEGETNISGDIGRTGNVGIGTPTPAYPLHIIGSGAEEYQKISNQEDLPVSMSFETPYLKWLIGQNRPPDMPVLYDGFFFYDDYVEQTRLLINYVGNVGIGAINPTQKLDIDGNIRIRGGFPGLGKVLTSDATGVATWQEPTTIAETDPTWSGDTDITGAIGRTGYVGIGTTTPTELLHVSGGDAMINSHTIGRGGGGLESNVVIGYQALHSNTTSGDRNVAIGHQALYSQTVGGLNTAIGYKSLHSNTSGYENTAIGHRSLYSNTEGVFNTANGVDVLYSNSTGNFNTASGYRALQGNTTGNRNTAYGVEALSLNSTANDNTALGYYALTSNTTGYENTAVGGEALYYNNIGYRNTAVGFQALYSSTANDNDAFGWKALFTNTTGSNNTALGNYSLHNNTEGDYNLAVGGGALRTNTTGNYNVGIGHSTILGNETGLGNTAVGTWSLSGSAAGGCNENSVLGYQAMAMNYTGSYNSAMGSQSLYWNSSGNYNTANGFKALFFNTSGEFNTAIGTNALYT
ncbi:MAG: hypothetical protein K0B81_07925, partial [Candidatus Cloacimonetes bacterium]|nr:hypothetical protein [Candidatus Cloacimonadota bacterium]